MSQLSFDYTNVLADRIGPEHGLTRDELAACAPAPVQRGALRGAEELGVGQTEAIPNVGRVVARGADLVVLAARHAGSVTAYLAAEGPDA